MHGFFGRILKVDLEREKYSIESISDDIFEKYSGGKGLASWLLYTHNPVGIDPFDPDNCLIFATGPVTGSSVWGSSRYGVFTKSPQTGLYSESYSGGRVPEAINASGFDAILIHGKSSEPSLLSIHPDGADFHKAGNIWGLDTYRAEDAVNKKFKGLYGSHKTDNYKKSGTIVIGPAGEKLVKFAVIENDYWRSAGRTGTGTVMGSKRLKAIFFTGDKKRLLFNKNKVLAFSKELAKEGRDDPGVLAYKSMGTPMMVKILNNANAFPTRYWAEGRCSHWQKISAEALHDRCSVKPNACAKCFIACGRMTTIKNGRHAGLKIEGPEYETIYSFGGLCLVDSIEEIAYLNDICDKMGMDTITAGNLCAFTIEASKKGKMDYKIEYGDVDAIADLLYKIANKEDIGKILSEGIIYAAKKWDMEDIAVHTKGLEPAGYDPRVLKGMGLAYATSDRGACHLRSTFYKPELSGVIDPDQTKGKAELFIDFEDRLTIFDTLILCRFYRDLYPWEKLEEIFQQVTGISTDKNSLKIISSSISDIIRRFNIREGMKPEDDKLPEKLHTKLEKTGHTITKKEIKTMVGDYYQLRGWDKNGIP